MRDLTRDRVVESVHGSGTYVAEQTVKPADGNGCGRHVLLVLPNFPRIDAVKEAALADGIFVTYYNSREDLQSPEAERHILETAAANGIRYAVVCPSPEPGRLDKI